MVRTRSTFAILGRLALAYAVAFQALFGAFAATAWTRLKVAKGELAPVAAT